MTEVLQALAAPIVYMFIVCLVASTFMHAFITTIHGVWQAIKWFKGFIS